MLFFREITISSSFFQDHECSGKSNHSMNAAGRAAMARQNQSQPPQHPKSSQSSITRFFNSVQSNSRPTPPVANPRQLQGNVNEDEALARALQASLNENGPHGASGASEEAMSQEEQDRMLALALAQSEQNPSSRQTTTAGGNNSSTDKSCQIS